MILLVAVLASSLAEKSARRQRWHERASSPATALILLAYAGMVAAPARHRRLLAGLPLRPRNLRSIVVLAAFVGIVALGQTFVIIGGGIDLSVPWVLNSAAILMTLLCGGRDLPLHLGGAAAPRRRRRRSASSTASASRVFGVPPIIMTLAANVILQGLILRLHRRLADARRRPALIKFLSVGRLGPVPVIALIWAALTLAASCSSPRPPSAATSMRSAPAPTSPTSPACRPPAPPS